ncbi:hypothetical protein PF005_g15411 [Phytophthora fragariae]|uniref:Uncharacterized protein n=1 Tax=Phytophthora fragariae TaxID=53985 RepID=A0A6A3QR49_9STRA|nr:hypothetical protein PF003_g29738 [Phytophthora fragariae]KAE8934061.1 hypothetical protein PF009_g15954 [Phytophthora fragariae]KAE9000148.1 hypothetical protein PF011_g14318 [Phytophthora fragariae]KAE9081460.1 hypothetical protein PF007_g22647 [Phytophthora fragariae]KAE9098575.1 hypothetical protein PF010_g15507 [Phytophthora fragariae]
MLALNERIWHRVDFHIDWIAINLSHFSVIIIVRNGYNRLLLYQIHIVVELQRGVSGHVYHGAIVVNGALIHDNRSGNDYALIFDVPHAMGL